MTERDQQIAIAEECGWDGIFKDDDGQLYGLAPDNLDGLNTLVPNYLGSLDAMHEAEKVLTLQQTSDYFVRLRNIVENNSAKIEYQIWHATATQRAEAFLKTLNLWVK